MIGNFLSAQRGTKGISETLAELLRSRNWNIITSSSYSHRLFRLMDMLWTTWNKRKDYDFAKVTVFSGDAFTWAEAVCHLLHLIHKPVILSLRGGKLPIFALHSPDRVRRLLAGADLVVTPSVYVKKELSQYRPDILHLPNGLDIENYSFRRRTNPQPKLCWLRAFHDIYNPTLAVEVTALLKETFPDVCLTMIGPDRNDGTLKASQQLILQKNLQANVVIAGQVSKADVPAWLTRNDIFLNTTRFESFGVAVMEAAAAGLPIVTTNVGELECIWAQDLDALLVPSDDAPAMAQAVRRLLTEPDLARSLSQNARKKAEQYDWSVILPQWESLFRQLSPARRSSRA